MLADTIHHSGRGDSATLSRHIMMIWMFGTLILMPVKIVEFPFNMELMDFWILMGLPVIWLYLILERQAIRLPYTVAMWLIVVASLGSTFGATEPLKGIIVLAKEIYLYLWFVTVTALLCMLGPRDLRRILFVWSATVILHGILILAQFLYPDLWRMICHAAGQMVIYEHFRAAGLFVEADTAGVANKAAFFQLLGFVPLVLASPSKKIATISGMLLFSSMLVTGSMGALGALIIGLISALSAITFLSKQPFSAITKTFAQLAMVASLLGGVLYFVVGEDQGYQEHLEQIVAGRAERSSEGRFNLWQRGIEVLEDSGVSLTGVGPENFRVVDWRHGKQLHNDLIAFVVERGLLGALGLVLFGATAMGRAIYLLLIYSKYVERPPFLVAVFLAAMVATLFESLTHQVFHLQHLWLVLAWQEAMLFRSQGLIPKDQGVRYS